MTTPNDIDVMLHYHVSPHPHERVHAPAVQEAINMFVKNGMLRPSKDNGGSGFCVTTKGQVWIDMLLATPFPVERFVDPRTLKESDNG